MEKKLLDSAHGWRDRKCFSLEQYWLVDDTIARITVRYSTDGPESSDAELLVLETDAGNEESLLRLRSFPSQWWEQLAVGSTAYVLVEEAPALLKEVAGELLARFIRVVEAVGVTGF